MRYSHLLFLVIFIGDKSLAVDIISPFEPRNPEISYVDREFIEPGGGIIPETFTYHKELNFFRKHFAGKLIGFLAMSHKMNKFMGWLQNHKTPFSLNWKKFAAKHNINLNEFEIPEQGFASFNEFFARRLKEGARPIDSTPGGFVSPADSKITYVENVSEKDIFIIKNAQWSLKKMLGDADLAQKYDGGTLISFRLAPEDYHRFHFPIDCAPRASKKIAGKYNSVNPYVFKRGQDPFGENVRNIVILESAEFSDPICIVVGAMGVGKIVETYTPGVAYKKGDEMGYFEFGASTVCLLFKKDIIKPITDRFTLNSQKMIETAIKMGQLIGCINNPNTLDEARQITPQKPEQTFMERLLSFFSW